MEFDQAYAGAADWSFPSPTATPTTTSFGNHLQTPKTTAFPSHFQDAFTTPQMPSYGTPQQPQYQSITPVQRPQSSSDTLRSNYYAAVQAQGGSRNMNHQAFPITRGGQAAEVWNGGMVQQSSQPQQGYTQYDPAQMQTPPPTRGTSAKKPQHMQSVAFGTPSTIASRRFASPQQEQFPTQANVPMQSQQQQQIPMQFPILQFSPDMQQFGNLGPSTAPVSVQSRNFWESQPNSATLGQPIMLDDPFGLNAQHQQVSWSPNPGMPQSESHAQAVNFNTPAMDSFPVQQPHPRPASAAAATGPAVSMSFPQTSAGVDPSLVYSSPIRPIVRSNSRAGKTRPTMEQVDISRRDSVASGGSGSSAPSSNASTSLRRSNTTGTARPRSTNPAEALSRSNSITQAPRTASPLKRMGKTPLGPISETKPRAQRASVILTVDENGRARTETRNAGAGAGSPTKSVRERYPGLFDSDSSDEESEDSPEPPSRNASFSFTKGEERRSKAARLDAPIENLEGLSLPRSHSSASVRVTPSRAAVAAAAQLKRQGSAKKSASVRSRRPLAPSNSSSSMIDTCPFGDQASVGVESTPSLSPEDSGPHRLYPPPPLFGSMEGNSSFSRTSKDSQNKRWNAMPYEQRQAAQAYQPVQQPMSIRCPCGNTNPCGEMLVQCKSCTQWQHPSCVGVDPMFGQPPSYTCFLCTRPTSSMRPRHLGRA